MVLAKVSLDLILLATDTGCLVPVKLGKRHTTIIKFDACYSLTLPPLALTVDPAQPLDLPNACARRNGLDVGDLSKQPEGHAKACTESSLRSTRSLPNEVRLSGGRLPRHANNT